MAAGESLSSFAAFIYNPNTRSYHCQRLVVLDGSGFEYTSKEWGRDNENFYF